MKCCRCLVLMMLITVTVRAQYYAFKADPSADSAWISQLLQQQNSIGKTDTHFDKAHWNSGIVLYSPDHILRIGQIRGHFEDQEFTTRIYQFNYNDTVIEKKLSEDYSIAFNPVVNIYQLPSNQYLLLTHDVDSSAQHILDVATVVVLADKEMSLGEFYPYEDAIDNQPDNKLIALSDIIPGLPHPEPLMKYDTGKAALTYVAVSKQADRDADPLYVIAYSSSYHFDNDVFQQVDDSSWYVPPLESFTKTRWRKTIKVGRYRITTRATEEYNDVNGGVFKVRKHDHRIGRLRFDCRFMEEYGLEEKTPAAKLLPNGALVFKTIDDHNYYTPGYCGGCEHVDHSFYYIPGDTSQLLLSISENTGNGRIEYSFVDIMGNSIEGSCSVEDATYLNPEVIWRSPKNITLRVSDGTESGRHYRDYDFLLITRKNKCRVSLVTGKVKLKGHRGSVSLRGRKR